MSWNTSHKKGWTLMYNSLDESPKDGVEGKWKFLMSSPRDPCVNAADAVCIGGRSQGREMTPRRLHREFLQGEGNAATAWLMSTQIYPGDTGAQSRVYREQFLKAYPLIQFKIYFKIIVH